MVALQMGCSLTGPVQAKILDQQVYQLQLVMDQIRRSCNNSVRA
ncbi:hypothetical protein KR52_08245 [Synechococcus sp. KORDI-52]|nr:hypothetical protein [Synechococcus sp. KORDI-52]AII49130.1 hypothetical protein KR52_08245 [Synechococcus sp. KORDI-52]